MKNLQILRKQKNLTQKELANALHVTQTSISDWERQRNLPHIDVITQIAKYFNVTIDYLIGLEPDSGLIYVHRDPALTDDEKQLLTIYRKIPLDKHLKVQRLLSFTFSEEIENE